MSDDKREGLKPATGGAPTPPVVAATGYPPYEVNISTLLHVEQIEGKFGFPHPGSHSVVVKAESGRVRISYTQHSPGDLHPILMVVIADADQNGASGPTPAKK